MLKKILTIQIDKESRVSSYLSLFAHSLKLTKKEFEVLAELIIVYSELRLEIKEPFLTELVLSTDRRKAIRNKLGIKQSHFNTIIASLKEKEVITSEGLIEMLYPSETVQFDFSFTESFNPFIHKEDIYKFENDVKDNVDNDIVNKTEEDVTENNYDLTSVAKNEIASEIDEEDFDRDDFNNNRIKVIVGGGI